jgi:hypothetical protein
MQSFVVFTRLNGPCVETAWQPTSRLSSVCTGMSSCAPGTGALARKSGCWARNAPSASASPPWSCLAALHGSCNSFVPHCSTCHVCMCYASDAIRVHTTLCFLGHRELQLRIADFMLRRTAELNEKYLPDKMTYTIFCRPSRLQVPQRQLSTCCCLSSSMLYSTMAPRPFFQMSSSMRHVTCAQHPCVGCAGRALQAPATIERCDELAVYL